MTTIHHQPTLTEGLTLLGWKLKRDAEIRERKDEANFECEVEPTSTSYAAFEYMSTTDDGYDPYAGLNVDLCLEVDAIDLNNTTQQNNDDYDPYEVFMRMNTRRTINGRERAPLAVIPSHSTSPLVNNYRHYNFADDDTPVKYPLAIGHVDRRIKPPTMRGGYTSRPSFEEERRSRGGMVNRPVIPSATSSYRQPSTMIPRRGIPSSYSGTREYPPSASSKRVTFRHSNDFNSGDDFDEDEEDEDSLEGDLHQPIQRRNKPPRRTAARIAVQRFRANHLRSSIADEDLDDDIAPTVTEMDMLEDQELDEDDDDEMNVQTTSTKTMSSPVKLPPPPPAAPPVKPTGGTIKSSYIGNMLPSFYEQLPESKKMLLQDATIDSSSNNSKLPTNTDGSTKNQIDIVSPDKKQAGLTTEHIEGPGGEEIIDEENRLQFRNTTITQPYKRSSNYQNSKRYYENDDEDDDQQQMRKRIRPNDDDYSSNGNNRQSQYAKQNRYRKYEDDEEYDVNQDTQQQQQLQQQQQQQEEDFQQTIRVPARRGRPPSQHHQQQSQQQEDPSKKYARIISQYEEQHGLKFGDMRVFAPKLRLRISSVNVNWVNLPPVPKLPNKVHQ
ncbi:hypothetical protein I4U23_030956 [Adineta vaga]|nr:hypothetical protein I4U23_030956 [Adineta vaga]